MPAITIEIDQAEWVNLENMLGKGLDRALKVAGKDIALRVLRDIKTSIIPGCTPYAPVDRGIYKASWKTRGVLSFGGGGEGLTIYSDAPHAAHIEYGVRAANVRPGKKMIAALTEWVVRKGIADEAHARSAAFAIANSMQQRGIFGSKGYRVLEKAIARVKPFIKDSIDSAITQVFG